MRRLIAATIAAAALVGATVVASSPSDAPVETYIVQPGDNFYAIADKIAPDADRGEVAAYLQRANGWEQGDPFHPGLILHYAPTDTAFAATTTTTEATTTTTVAPTTTTVAPVAGFVEMFDGNQGGDRFATGVFHRDDTIIAQTSWTGDHDLSCGSPDTQRTIRRENPDDSFYACRDHWMTSVGDTSGYSIGWFSPDADRDGQPDVFTAAEIDRVAWDVNVTDLGNRQWWEVVLIPEGDAFLTTVDWVASIANIEGYTAGTVAVGKGPFGNDGNIYSGGSSRDPLGWQHVCGAFAVDPTGCGSKALRRSFSMTDNDNGTITFDFFGERTYPGEFPERFHVFFKDHNYTPNKDGMPVGHTWHWDSIVVE